MYSAVNQAVNDFLDKSYAKNTLERYYASADQYTSWAQESGLWEGGMVLLPSEPGLMAWVSVLASPGMKRNPIKHGTILGKLSGLSQYWKMMVGKDPVKGPDGATSPQLAQTLRGIRRTQIRNKKTAEPLTTDRLKVAAENSHKIPTSKSFQSGYSDILLNAMATVAVYALLRVGECTSSHVKDQDRVDDQGSHIPTHDITRNLCWSDVVIYYDREPRVTDFLMQDYPVATHFTILLKDSKTDIFRDGSLRRVYATGTTDCPVRWMVKYMEMRVRAFGPVQRSQPFFVRHDGKWATKDWFALHLRMALTLGGLDASATSSHSCRAGGACSLLAGGASPEQVQLLGRWTSQCFLGYLQLPPVTLKQLTRRMAQLNRGDLDHNERAHLTNQVLLTRESAE